MVAWLFALLAFAPARAATDIQVHFFWSADCPHCQEMARALDAVAAGDDDVAIHRYEVSRDPDGAALFTRAVEGLGLPAVVPIVIVGDAVLVGHQDGAEGQLSRMVASCRAEPCPDLMAPVLAELHRTGDAAGGSPRLQLPQTVNVPLIGELDTASLSLPLLTIAMAAIDGFNPCAMWVLVFLIGLLLGIRDRRRMWLLASAFLIATAAVYFLFLAAWLNVLLVLGALVWLRFAIGALALVAGGAYLREALRREEVCPVTAPERRRRIFERLRRLVQEPSLGVAMAGVALLAVAVNLVELLCSAGIPAVYTSVLAQAELPPLHYYAYLALYVIVFLADDTAVVVAAMTTLSIMPLNTRYTRWVRLAGALVMLVLGALLILRPGWLAFSV